MVKSFVEGAPSVRKEFYERSALLHGRWLFLAYLQGIETPLEIWDIERWDKVSSLPTRD